MLAFQVKPRGLLDGVFQKASEFKGPVDGGTHGDKHLRSQLDGELICLFSVRTHEASRDLKLNLRHSVKDIGDIVKSQTSVLVIAATKLVLTRHGRRSSTTNNEPSSRRVGRTPQHEQRGIHLSEFASGML